MRLYKMELYKLCNKKIFIVGMIGVIALVLLTFGIQVWDEEATVDGIRYTGYQAVRVNREITEEFKGVITDEKAERIVEKYGFPSKVEHGWNYFRDANFLNQFVMVYLSDGYINSEDDYHVAEKIYPIADTTLGEVMAYTGKEIILEYYHGWSAFLEVLAFGMTAGSILVICSLSGIFAMEGQTKMLALLFTSKEGKEKDVHAKTAAALTVALGIWLTVFLLDLLLCGSVYGFDGLHCYNGMVVYFLFPWDISLIPMGLYIGIAALFSFFGILSLCFITMCISARQKSVFHAVVISALCYGAPVLAAMLINGLYGIAMVLYCTPVFMVIYRIIEDVYRFWMLPVGISVMVSLLCFVMTYRKYKRQQVT